MSGVFISIAGNIGAGKSSLAPKLASALGADVALERWWDNPFILPITRSGARLALAQVWFLLEAARLAPPRTSSALIQERHLEEHAAIFVPYYRAKGRLDASEDRLLGDLHEALMACVDPPDLMVYLYANPGVLLHRISRRGHALDAGVDIAMLTDLNDRYDAWLAQRTLLAPVLPVDTGQRDLRSEVAFNELLEEVQRALEGVRGGTTKPDV
jgi:deoxyadenosine/deoxycytidine kinase